MRLKNKKDIFHTHRIKPLTAGLFTLLTSVAATAQNSADNKTGMQRLTEDIHYKVEMQSSVSDHKTPLWLNANKYGLSSLDDVNGYMRGSISRPLQADSARKWAVGYGVDVAVPLHYTSKVVVQQAYAEVKWKYAQLTVGSKEWPMELKNNSLSSGSQTLGINARPVPQVRLALPDYWVLPFGNGWLRIKGHIAYGKMTDEKWQHEFTQRKTKYADGVLYHSKAGYLMIGNPEQFQPFSVELGLEMAAQFSGRSYMDPENGHGYLMIENSHGWKSFLEAFVPSGSETVEKENGYKNVGGDQLGSWLIRLNYDTDKWRLSAYADKFFEDHSAMFLLDYDGYGTGDEWNEKKDMKFFMYDFKDIMLGLELNLKYGTWLRNIVAEYIYSKYQSGPVYHDRTPGSPVHIAGDDDFYNHYVYTGWQHWGQVMGNPLYTSPIYNTDGEIMVSNNRFEAWHLGVNGHPTPRLGYKVLATWQEGFGTYKKPFTKVHHNTSVLAEIQYDLRHGWQVKVACGMDWGHILGHNSGCQLTVSKSGLLTSKNKKR